MAKAETQVLCAMLNIAQLPVSFSIYSKNVDSAVSEVNESFIVPTVRKALAENDKDALSHKTACFDSCWQKVGHNSLNDIILAKSLGTRDVLHVEIMNKFCFVFHTNLTSKHTCKCENN
jgi:hypothetical protein